MSQNSAKSEAKLDNLLELVAVHWDWFRIAKLRKERKMSHQGTLSKEMRHCIDVCNECADTCFETINHCLREGGKHVEHKHIGLLQVCAETCEASAHAMLLGSEFHKFLCGACAEICSGCAESCETVGSDETMKNCADACRRCAESCEKMAGDRIMSKSA